MNNVAAYALVVLGGNATPSVGDVTAVITACGGEVDAEKLDAFMADMEGKNIAEVFAAGIEKVNTCVATCGSGGGGAAPAAGGDAAAAAPAAAAPKEEEVDALEGGMDMFGGGGGDY